MKVIRPKDLLETGLRAIFEDDRTPNFRGIARAPTITPTAPLLSSPATHGAAPVRDPNFHPGPLELGGQVHAAHFGHPSTTFSNVKRMPGGANSIYKAQSNNGTEYMIKPHGTAANGHEPEQWAPRNTAANRLLDRMNASHMGVHGFGANFPKTPGVGVQHSGRPAHVTVLDKDVVTAGRATDAELNNISGEHRLTGLVHHVLTSNPDGHHGNVLINKKHNHPVHIDHDIAFNSVGGAYHSQPTDKNPEGKRAVMSVYNPGEDLDYTKGMMTDPVTGEKRQAGPVGTNFPPHIAQTLHDAAAGRMSDGLSAADHDELVNNAKDLLHHGLEGTMARRYLTPTYKKRKELGWKDDE